MGIVGACRPESHSYDAEKRHALDLWGSYGARIVAGKLAPYNLVELAQAQ